MDTYPASSIVSKNNARTSHKKTNKFILFYSLLCFNGATKQTYAAVFEICDSNSFFCSFFHCVIPTCKYGVFEMDGVLNLFGISENLII